MRNAVRLWWGLAGQWKVLLHLAATLFPVSILSGESADPFTLVFLLAWFIAIVGAGIREDEVYAALNIPQRVWAKHRRADLLLSVPIYVGILWFLPLGSAEQIIFGAVGLVRPLRVLLKKDLRPRGISYLGEPLAERNTHADAAGDQSGRKWWPWRWIKYSETPVGQGIMEPQITAWVGWASGLIAVALISVVLRPFIDISVMGITMLLVLLGTVGAGAFTEEAIQRSYAQWIRFGGSRAVWGRWTAAICGIPLSLSAIIGVVLGVSERVGVAQGLIYGLGAGIVVVPAVVLLSVAGKNNAGWVVLGIAMAAIFGALGLAGTVSVTQWFLLQSTLGMAILLALPALIRGSAHELWGLGTFFGFKKANVDQT